MNTLHHEKQSKQLCLVHALNAILQRKEFTQQSLDEICYGLNESKWFNPHKSMIGLGNYDANVLMAALAIHDYQVVWFDARQPVEKIDFEKVDAAMFNIPSTSFIPFYKGRHWFTVLNTENGFVNLDSKLQGPAPVPDIYQFSRDILSKDHNQLMLITKGNSENIIRKE